MIDTITESLVRLFLRERVVKEIWFQHEAVGWHLEANGLNWMQDFVIFFKIELWKSLWIEGVLRKGIVRSEQKKRKTPYWIFEEFGSNPFDGLVSEGLNSLPTNLSSVASPKVKVSSSDKLGKGERLEVRREKSGRGGKTVTTIKGFPSRISQDDFKRMLKGLKSRLGTGGVWRDNQMEIQGDQREWPQVAVCFGFWPVLAGG